VRFNLDRVDEQVMGTTRTEKRVWDRIRWDVPLDSQAFQPPPLAEGESVEEQNLNIAAPTEAALIEGLRAYAAQSKRIHALLDKHWAKADNNPDAAEEMENLRKLLHLDSAYPEQLDINWLTGASLRESSLLAAKGISANQRDDEEAVKRAQEESAQAAKEMVEAVGPVAFFYRKLLLEDREPEYFGKTVEPGDGSAVLIRWKLDDERMRVIYGDLRAETVPAN